MQEVITVRGERCAAAVLVIGHGEGASTDEIFCLRLASDMKRMDRAVVFGFDDVEGAVAELVRMEAEIAERRRFAAPIAGTGTRVRVSLGRPQRSPRDTGEAVLKPAANPCWIARVTTSIQVLSESGCGA